MPNRNPHRSGAGLGTAQPRPRASPTTISALSTPSPTDERRGVRNPATSAQATPIHPLNPELLVSVPAGQNRP
ncbi:MAG TPA: hypothetical protein VG674_05095, partial [Amycolatopsis sp.]|nr:hypothetical protein [Amycolatopsis sp.]